MSICNILQNYSYIDINTIDTSNFTEEDYKRVVLNDIHLINFKNNLVPKTPFFFEELRKKDNRLWAGDIDCSINYFNKNYLFNQKMKEYNIFYFYINANNIQYTFKNVYNNLTKINNVNGRFNYLLCLIDIEKNGKLFSDLFKNFFIKYYVSHHNASLNISYVSNILKKKGCYYLQDLDSRSVILISSNLSSNLSSKLNKINNTNVSFKFLQDAKPIKVNDFKILNYTKIDKNINIFNEYINDKISRNEIICDIIFLDNITNKIIKLLYLYSIYKRCKYHYDILSHNLILCFEIDKLNVQTNFNLGVRRYFIKN